ncbi:hypothetical protein [Stenotrophomonas rhizophila]|uniref:hypothetical protein n=1 Tax=Stenotrophomonas rhizophila TaxID=216778 RepID=UPI001E3830D5|nr:hypothetical protein [Stenotrophomonas rhizophila]MCC7633226.1 hypothetical protein [Stenotrophomonas rhizophila]MCC7662119.1 hypothetical protein [Stenotrophomonas rhizophila]
MSATHGIALALAVIVLLGSARLLWPPRQGSRLRLAALLVLQAASAALLYLTLVPPSVTAVAHRLTVLTANAAALQATTAVGDTVIALPEAAPGAGSMRAPDLATALRQHPGTQSLRVIGDGLPARDRDTALTAQVSWIASAPPRGWVALQPPAITAPGAVFAVRARAQGVATASAELLDPAGVVVDRARIAGDGRVRLQGVARASGRSEFSLRLLDAGQHVVDTMVVPLRTVDQPAPRVLIVAGAPGPELKYLRRWATDTGLAVQAQASAGGGVMLGDAPVALNAARLAASDVLILDERSLAALDGAQRGAVQQALRNGLGVLVRTSGPLSDSARQALRRWGLAISGSNQSVSLTLPADPDPALLQARRGPQRPASQRTAHTDEADTASRSAAAPALEQLSLRAADAGALLHDAKGAAIGGWRSIGQGRLALLPVTDSYRLVLAGRDDRHAELWSGVLTTLARPLPASATIRPGSGTPWAGERIALCNLPGPIQVRAPDGSGTTLVIDPSSGAEHCAGYWPQQPGWHQLQHGDAIQALYVFDPAGARALYRQQLRDANAVHLGDAAHASAATHRVPGPGWPWLLAFVLVSGLLWWLERRRPRADSAPA